MRQIAIDFKTSPIEAGYLGEHNATEIVVAKPADLSGLQFSVAFQTNGEVIHSKYFSADEEIRVSLWQQLTQDNVLGVQLESYDENGAYIGKSATVRLLLKNSVHGTDVVADADNSDVYSEIAQNSSFRETLEDNLNTLDKLTTSETGKLLFDGKLIEGSGGGGSAEIPTKTSQLENDSGFITANDLPENQNIIESFGVNTAKTRPTFKGEHSSVRVTLAAIDDVIDRVQSAKRTLEEQISAIPKFAIEVVDELPGIDISDTTVYLVKDTEDDGNLYTEYIYVNGVWESLGSQNVDLSNYYTKEEIDGKGFITSDDLLDNGNVVINLSSITSDINTSSFSVKELQGVDNIKKDTEFVSIINKEKFVSQAANNYKTDKALYKNKPTIVSETTSEVLTSEFRMVFPTGQGLDIVGTQEFDVIVYIPDVSKITRIEVRLSTYLTSTLNVTFFKSANELHNGWNYLRFLTKKANLTQWGVCTMFRVLTYTTEPTTVYFGDIVQVKPNKARVLFVDDHGYSDFKSNAYPLLKAQGIPVTWAIQPGRPGQVIENAGTLLTAEEITELSNDPFSEFSWHTYNGANTSEMTELETQTDCQKSIAFLRKNGLLPQYYWRAAWKNNIAPYARSCDDLMNGGAYYSSVGGLEVFPFEDKYNILRYSIHGRTNSDIDAIFNTLKNTHCTAVFYTHGIVADKDFNENTTMHITNSEFDYFVQKLSTGVSEGWLEGTTFNRLMLKYGDVEFNKN